MSQNFLLVGSKPHSAWAAVLRRGLEPLGDLRVVAASELLDRHTLEGCDLFIIDAASVEDVTGLVARLRRESASVPIVVVTTSPTWQRAKQLFMVGADDYVRKSMDVGVLCTALGKILANKGS